MPRCNKCNGCLNHQDGYNCRKCKWCLDTKREGGPNKLRKPCMFRTCVLAKKGEDVKRMKVKNPKTKKRKGKKKVLRRDSGFDQGKSCESGDSASQQLVEQGEEEARVGGGRDSGVGSHDGEGRDWGRKVTNKSERRIMNRMARLLEELSQSTSGQVNVVFMPGDHPNLPGLQTQQTVMCFPGRKVQKDQGVTSGDWQVEGDHLTKLGLEEADVLACRMPDLLCGSQVVVTVGLGLDLARLGRKRRQYKERVVTWLMALLELSFPDKLRSAAVDIMWQTLDENLEYVNECGFEEASHFALEVLELPEDVVEMASIVSEEDVPPLDSASPISASQLDLTGLSLNTTALDQAVDTVLLGQPVHGEDDNFSYTATVLDMDQLDLDSLTSLMTPHRQPAQTTNQLFFQSQNQFSQQTTPGENNLLQVDHMVDYPPLPHLPNNLQLTPFTTSHHFPDQTTSVATDAHFSFGMPDDIPVSLDTSNMVTLKGVEQSPVVEDDGEARPGKRARREPSRFKDYTSPVLR